MNLFKRMRGGKGTDEEPPMMSLADEIRELAKREDAAARDDERSGLVAIYPELGASRRKRRGFAELDLDDYVPELDDYEPGLEGEFLPAEDLPAHAQDASPPPVAEALAAMRRASTAEPPRYAAPLEPAAPAYAPGVDADLPQPPRHEPPVDLRNYALRGREAEAESDPPALVQVPNPAMGRAGVRRAGRVKTRLLGFDSLAGANADPFETGQAAPTAAVVRFPVGWIVVISGPGRGASFTLFNGVSAVGRGDDQPVKLDFGDTSISRTNHAVVAYDNEQRKFFLGHGGKANIVRLNGKPVLSTEELAHNDLIRIGETTLRFLALCGADFDWTDEEGNSDPDASRE
jgi:hypothetical protein